MRGLIITLMPLHRVNFVEDRCSNVRV